MWNLKLTVTLLILVSAAAFSQQQTRLESVSKAEPNRVEIPGQESGGGIVFGASGQGLIFGAEERTLEFVVSTHSVTKTVYDTILSPQLMRLGKIWGPLALYLKRCFEGKTWPRCYMSRFEMRPTTELVDTDVNIATYSNAPGQTYQLARNNGDEIKISNFDPKIYPMEQTPLGETTALGGGLLRAIERKRTFFCMN